MKVISGFVLTVCLAALFTNACAQVTLSSIQGKVITDKHAPAESATVILLNARDSSIISSTIIGKNGRYRFDEVIPDHYLLLATLVGFNKAYGGPYKLNEGETLKAVEIILKPSATQLKEVVISGSRPEVEVKPGKITLNIPNSLSADGSSAFEILRRSPGVRVDNSNNISLIGKQAALVTIDGKTTNLTGEDLAAYLKSIQSGMMEKIEFITSASAKYDASGGGIINIVMKKGNNFGSNGSITATAGYGKYYKSNIGINFNNRVDKLNIFGGYTYSADKTFHNFMNNRYINFEDVLSHYDVDYKTTQTSDNHNFNLGADFLVSPTQTIGFLVNGFSRQDNYVKNNRLNISNQGALDSIITASSNLDRHISKINYNLNYNGKLDKEGTTLSADVNYTTFSRSSAEYINNNFYNPDGSSYRDQLQLENLSPSRIRIWLSKLDFSAPVSKNATVEAGIKYSHVTSNNDLVFGPMIGDAYVPDPNLSNHFFYTENINAGYVNYQGKFEKMELTAGLRAEQTSANGNSITMDTKIDHNYFGLFPQAMVIYHKDKKNDYSLSYNRGITRPVYEEINPFLYYVDLYDYRSGNPDLKPEYTNQIELTHTYDKTLSTTLYALMVSNAYDFGFYDQNDSTKVNVRTQKNFGRIFNYGIRFSDQATFTNWWTAFFRLDASYQRYIAYKQNGNLNKGDQDIIFNSTQNFRLNNSVSASVTAEYESPNFYGITQNKARYEIDAAIGTQLFNKRGTLKFAMFDIFNTLRDRGAINYQNLNMNIVDKKESQIGRLTFTYRFGKTSVKAAEAHKTGNEEEQKRIGIGSGN